jgi:hypothetical protein
VDAIPSKKDAESRVNQCRLPCYCCTSYL